jgi:hypothetical protein
MSEIRRIEFKLTDEDIDLLESMAELRGVSTRVLCRSIITEWLNEKAGPIISQALFGDREVK